MEGSMMRYSWLDLVLYLVAIVLLIPLVVRFVEAVLAALEGIGF
jgi:hypothetical protein